MASPIHCRALASSTTISSRGLVSGALSRQGRQNQLGSLIARRYKSGPYGYTQAKALVYSNYGEPADVLSLHNHSISPSLPSKSILLRTLATPINPADINQIQGVYPSKPPFTSLLGTTAPSAVGGNEGCFEVASLGPGISTLAKGDWVIMKSTGFGTWRTHAVAEESQVLKIANKEGLTSIQVGTVSVNPCTAYRMLRDFENMVEGDWFIQNGANSGVGRAAIQLGKRWGYKSINIIRDRANADETEAMRKELLELGATKVVTESELMAQSFRDQVKEWTNGGREKVRVGLNCVGGTAAGALVKCLSQGGHLVTYGGMSKKPLMLPTAALIFKDIKFSGYWVSRWSDGHPDEKKKTVDEILEMTRLGMFKDIPVQELRWDWETKEDVLTSAVRGTLEGFRSGKGVFVYGET
ncbi:mitochondrial 2-enoyl thioester reductase [Ciborinia camelliae]|nr:mitochondrial 2-enoyl thioester reductase [Ciborinia camelliae]